MRTVPIAMALLQAHAGCMSTQKNTPIQALRESLQAREQQLRRELEAAQIEQVQQAQDTEDLPREPDANETHEVSDREVRHAELLRDQQELQAVRAALQRIADGSYGECVNCGKAIAVERLKVNPAAMRCIACQTLAEAKA